MNASYQVSVYLAKRLQRRVFITDSQVRSRLMIILDIEERKKKENRHTVRGFDNGTFTSEYLNMSKLFCWQLLLVGNFTFAIYVVLLIVGNLFLLFMLYY